MGPTHYMALAITGCLIQTYPSRYQTEEYKSREMNKQGVCILNCILNTEESILTRNSSLIKYLALVTLGSSPGSGVAAQI